MKSIPDLPPLWWLGSIALNYLSEWVPPLAHLPVNVLTTLSWVIFVCTVAVIVWSGLWFLNKKTPIEPHHTPKTLIIEGPYRLSRNPISGLSDADGCICVGGWIGVWIGNHCGTVVDPRSPFCRARRGIIARDLWCWGRGLPDQYQVLAVMMHTVPAAAPACYGMGQIFKRSHQ